MLNRKLERDNAWKFAGEIEKLLNNPPEQDGGRLLAKLREWRESGKLAPSPSATRTVLQLYADWMAEYVCENFPAPEKPEDSKFPTPEELEKTPDFPKEFAKLFQENGEYAQYGRPVYETHQATCRLFRAAAAYAALRPGKKGGKDAAPAFQAIRQAADGVKELPMTFDVYSNKISPMERYARALSRNGRQEKEPGTWRVPVKILRDCGSPEEATLITLIYYRHLTGIRQVKHNFTDFYRVPQAETGVYLAGRDQTAAVQKLVEQTRRQQVGYEKARNKGAARDKRRKHLRFTQLSLGPGDAKTYLAAISQEAFEAFRSCNKKGAKREDYLEISEEKPRAVLEALAEKPEKFEGVKGFMTAEQYAGKAEHSDILAALKRELSVEIWDSTWKNQQAKPAGPFRNASATWVLRLAMAAHWLKNGKGEEKTEVAPNDLTALLEQADAFNQLERAKREVFWREPPYQMTLGHAEREQGKRLYYRIFEKQEEQKPETTPEGPEGVCKAAEAQTGNLPPQEGGTV